MVLLFLFFSTILVLRFPLDESFENCHNSSEVSVLYKIPNWLSVQQLTVTNWIYFSIIKNDLHRPWPEDYLISIAKVRDYVKFIYKPSNRKMLKTNQRFFFRLFDTYNFNINMSFEKWLDDDSQWTLSSISGTPRIHNYICRFFIRRDVVPYPILTYRKAKSDVNENNYKIEENDEVVISCNLQNLQSSGSIPTLILTLPDKAIQRDGAYTDMGASFSVIVRMTRDIWNKPVVCSVIGGISATNVDMLRFQQTKYLPQRFGGPNAVLAVMITILFIMVLPIGICLIIVMQRTDTTQAILVDNTKRMKSSLSESLTKIKQKMKNENLEKEIMVLAGKVSVGLKHQEQLRKSSNDTKSFSKKVSAIGPLV